MTTLVHLVGDKDSSKTNSWLAMTNSLKAAEMLVEDMAEATLVKTIEVKPPRYRGKKREQR